MKVIVVMLMLTLTACGAAQTQVASIPADSSNSHTQAVAPQPTLHIITYGQSLSLGARAVVNFPVDDSLPNDYQNVGWMFAGGTKPDDLSSLSPFAESASPVNLDEWNIAPSGETPLYGALLSLKGQPGIRMGSAAGRGGTAIVDLSRGTAPYARLMAQVQAGRALASGAYTMTVIWMQGESDTGNANYASEFEQLVMDLDADVRAVTHQGPLQVYVCLPAVPEIAAAQKAVAAAMPQVHIACDTSTLAHSDGLHLTALSSRQAGSMLGSAMLQ